MQWLNQDGSVMNPQPTNLQIAQTRLDYARTFIAMHEGSKKVDADEAKQVIKYLLDSATDLMQDVHKMINTNTSLMKDLDRVKDYSD